MPARGNFDDIIRDTYRTQYGKLKDIEADQEANSQPQGYPLRETSPYVEGGIEQMLHGMDMLHMLYQPQEEYENLYRYPNTGAIPVYSNPGFLSQDEADRQKNEMLQGWMTQRPAPQSVQNQPPLSPEDIDAIKQQMLMRRMRGQ